MKKAILAGVAALAIAGSTAVYAHQHHSWFHEHTQFESHKIGRPLPMRGSLRSTPASS